MQFSKCARAIKNLILAFCCLLAAAMVFTTHGGGAFAEQNSKTQAPLGPIDYLDYKLTSPSRIYADEEIVAITSNGCLVFFYNGGIYQTELLSDGEIQRSGNRIYYFHHSLVYYTEIGSFTENALTDSNGQPIASSSFSINGNRLLVVNSSGAGYYEELVKKDIPYTFDQSFDTDLLKAANVLLGERDYFSVAGEIYANGEFVKAHKADYMTEIDGTLFYANKEGIFHLGKDEPIYSSLEDGNHTVAGISAYGDGLLFIDAVTGDIMQINTDGSELKKFFFDVRIKTDITLTNVESPLTVTIAKGQRLHGGVLSGGEFSFTGTIITEADEDWVQLGAIESYSLLYGRGGYAMVQTNSIAEIEQNTQISFEKGVILHNCQLFSVPVANGETTIDNLMRGQQITVNSVYIMNGIKYLAVTVIGNDTEHTGFVLAGEVTEKLYPSEGSTINESGNVTGKDNTTLAGMIILLSTATFITTIFVILIKKDYIKL